ncbi:transposase [Streptomyces sp. CNQ085]|uniref:IS701 family transposase n=1 Tax=Streptomyces sp. CNQ085 TaxID=2886944 RepID=UPI001F513242|nr:transposase [Streptomyces sp. CNQ085]MCI0383204.1 transposase [Streptomyces sp. CNQ085]
MTTPALTNPLDSVSAFADNIFEYLPRTDQRRWARTYLWGLLTTPGKKSVRRLASVSGSPTAFQSLHQFVNASPWDWAPVREELVRWVERRARTQAWVVDLAVLRKRGEHSCGVHRRFVPSTGRSVTCQVGVGAFLATPKESVPVDWRLMLPGSWSKDPQRRKRARIPDDIHGGSAERHVLDLLDALTSVSRAAPVPVVADLSASPGAADLVRGLALRDCRFAVAVPDNFKIVLGRHLKVQRRNGPGDHGLALSARSIFQFDTGGLFQLEKVPSDSGHKRGTTVMSSLVHLPTALMDDSQPPRTYQLFAVRSAGDRRPPKLWLTSLTHSRVEERLALVRTLRRTSESVRRMEDFGLLDFEGRSYPGWHHHMTLVSAAYAYSRLHGPETPGRSLPTAA